MARRKPKPTRSKRTQATRKSAPRARRPAGTRSRAAKTPARRAKTGSRPVRAAASRSAKAPGRRPALRRPPARGATAPSAVPNAIGFISQHMDYSSHALDEVRRFYAELLGFAQSEYDPKIDYLYVQTGPSSSLGFMPPRPGPPEDWRPPREPTLYIMVKDVDRVHRELVAKGVVFERPPEDMTWGHRVASLRDPEGRMVALAQGRRRSSNRRRE